MKIKLIFGVKRDKNKARISFDIDCKDENYIDLVRKALIDYLDYDLYSKKYIVISTADEYKLQESVQKFIEKLTKTINDAIELERAKSDIFSYELEA